MSDPAVGPQGYVLQASGQDEDEDEDMDSDDDEQEPDMDSLRRMVKDLLSPMNTKLPKVTDDLVRRVETRWRIKLPRTYVALCKVRNGSYLQRPFWTGGVHVDSLCGLDERKKAAFSSFSNLHQCCTSTWGAPKRYFPLCGDGHS